jgi:hypothetical protein
MGRVAEVLGHLAAETREHVDAYCGAFVVDLDGHDVEAVRHAPS